MTDCLDVSSRTVQLSLLSISYGNGTAGNGIRGTSNFNFTGSITDSYGGSITKKPTINRVEPTGGGSGREDVASIKFRAPRSYANQNRCVAKDDYAAIVKDIYPAIDDIFVYGGEELEIPSSVVSLL